MYKEVKPLREQFNFEQVKRLNCHCGTTIEYGMMTVMSLFDVEYVECPYCNSSHVIDIEEFRIKENE